MSEIQLGRRQFLRATGGLAVLAATGGAAAACGSDDDVSGGGNGAVPLGATGVELPAYIPSDIVTPDIPATKEGVLAGFYEFPRDPVNAFDKPPASDAGTVSILTNMFYPVPSGVDSNAYWQAVNQSVGATLDVTMTPAADYLPKLSTIVASGDLPDLMLISSRLANRAEVLHRLCADLTPYLSGDAVADYPFLANFPTDSWLPTVYQGGIYGIPIPRAIVGTIMFARKDLLEDRGLTLTPQSFDEFTEIAVELTEPSQNRWAFGNPRGLITYIGNMLGVPNAWREDGGKFTSEYETEERREAVARVAEMVDAGLFHPDAVSESLNLRDLFGNGTIALGPDGYAAWDILADTYDVDVAGIPAPAFDGNGAGVQRAGSTSFGIVALKKADDQRIDQVLRVANWLATPLGTTEYMLRKYGLEGTHYDWQDGSPALTDTGQAETTVPFEYVTDSPPVLGPQDKTRVDAQRAYQEEVIGRIERDASAGLYSETEVNKAGELAAIIKTAELDVVSGRKSIDAWDDAVRQWRSSGGDQIRAEYEAAIAATASPTTGQS